MQITPLGIEGAWLIEPRQHGDDRGVFLEWFKASAFEEAVGHTLDVRQSNLSTSRAGTVRGIHLADLPPGQAKYVTCVSGAVYDVVVDLRLGSPTFGRWEGVLLDDVNRNALYLSEGLGHGYCALQDDSAFLYLCSTPYDPDREHGIHPLDPAVGVDWPSMGRDGAPLERLLSPKDQSAPSLAEVSRSGRLPTVEEVRAYRDGLSRDSRLTTRG